MSRRIAILTLLLCLSAVAMAQNDSILVAGKDTVAYRYTPMEQSTSQSRGSKGWQRFVEYIERGNSESVGRQSIVFVPGLYYAPSTSLGLALMAAGRYRLDKRGGNTPASDFSLYAAVSLTGYYRVGLKGNNIFRNDNQRLIYNAEFLSQPTNFWGIGYDAAMGNGALKYLASRTIVDVRFLQKVTKGLYVGAGADYNYHFGKFGGSKYASEEQFMARLGGEGAKYNTLGISLLVEYDIRDNIHNPQRGAYVALQVKVRPRGMSNVGQTLWAGYLTANYYQRLWRGAVLAFDLRGELNSVGTPWVYNASIGGVQAMRGYYAGRFNDLCAITLQAELRQNIYRRLGAVAWGGAGNVFHSFATFDITQTLPTYGVGLRYEVKRNINFRFDYGFGGRDRRGKLVNGFVFSMSEAF